MGRRRMKPADSQQKKEARQVLEIPKDVLADAIRDFLSRG